MMYKIYYYFYESWYIVQKFFDVFRLRCGSGAAVVGAEQGCVYIGRVVITVVEVCKVVAESNPGKTKAVLKCFGWSSGYR